VALGLAGLYTFNSVPAKAVDLSPKPAQVLQLDNLELKLEMPKQGLEQKFLPELSQIPAYEVDKEESQKEEMEVDKPIDWTNYFVKIPFNAGLSFIATVFAHEIGHATTAKLLGAKDVKIHGPNFSKGLMGSSSYTPPDNLTDFQENLISSYGTGTTSFLSDIFYQALKEDQIPDALKQLTATTSLMMLADRHRYIWSSAIKNYLRMDICPFDDFNQIMQRSFDSRLDLEDLSNQGLKILNNIIVHKDTNQPLRIYADKQGKFRELMKQHNVEYLKEDMPKSLQKKIDVAYGIALGMSALELGLRWEEISFLTQTALGMDAKRPEGHDLFHAGFYPLLEGGFFVSLDGTW